MRTLTARQIVVLEAIRTFIAERGYPPTLAELAPLLGTTRAAVRCHFDALIRKGRLSRQPCVARGIRVLEPCRGEKA